MLVLEQSVVDVDVVLHDNARLLYARRNRSDRPGVKRPSRERHVVFFGLLSGFGSVRAYSSPCLCELAHVEPSSGTTKTDGKTVVFLVVRQM